MPRRGEREEREEGEKQNALFLSHRIQRQSQQRLYSSAFCFGSVCSSEHEDDLQREDTGSVDAGWAVQGLSSKCKNYRFSNANFCTDATGTAGLCGYIWVFPLKSGQCLHLCIAHGTQTQRT